eukprot:scaffold1282_cov251-Pinguiococcus_pyrenoidosus.AAC.36
MSLGISFGIAARRRCGAVGLRAARADHGRGGLGRPHAICASEQRGGQATGQLVRHGPRVSPGASANVCSGVPLPVEGRR